MNRGVCCSVALANAIHTVSELEVTAMYTQSDILVKTLDSPIKYEICWHCGFVLKT